MPDKFGLYAILTDPVTGYEACAEAVIQEEIKYLQLRMKNIHRDDIFKMAEKLSVLTKGTKTHFIVNDDAEIAKAVNADGVHVGQDDMPLNEVRKLWDNPDKIFGLSTHNPDQEKAARDLQPDYIGVGPVFPTPTKANPDPVVGVQQMGQIIKDSPLTTVAIGGIDEFNLEQVLNAGAINFCAVRAITQSDNPRKAIQNLMNIWHKHNA